MKKSADKILFAYNDKLMCAGIIKPETVKYVNIIEMIMATTARPMGLLTDRTGTFKGRYNIDPKPIPMPWKKGEAKTFDDLSEERAKQLIALNKNIIVGWSGGIDSTHILIQLLQNIDDPKRIKVLMSAKSIKEHPDFFEDHIKGSLNYEIPDKYFATVKPKKDEIFVTGDQIAQIFNMAFMDGHPNANDPWLPWVESKFTSEVHKKWFFDNIQPWLEKCPIEIETVFDYVWWVTFSLRWNNSRYRNLRWNKTYTKTEFSRVHSFFRTEEFQKWSIENHRNKIGPKGHFKEVMKEAILKFDGNQEYYDNKKSERSSGPSFQSVEIPSRKKLLLTNQIPVFVDENFKRFFYDEVKKNPQEYEKILHDVKGTEWFPDIDTGFDKKDWYDGYGKI